MLKIFHYDLSFLIIACGLWMGTFWGKVIPPAALTPPDPSIVTRTGLSPSTLVKDIFAKGACDNITNIQPIGHAAGIGYFENGQQAIGLDRGIILATGPVHHAEGPNSVGDKSGDFGSSQSDPDLSGLATGPLRDVVGLEFDFEPLDSFVTFRYVFASEEYCEFVGSKYNDVFGFFISGPGIEGSFTGGAQNVALVPGTNDFVAINAVNHLKNAGYYVRNERPGDAGECGLTASLSPHLPHIEYDGFTRQMTALLRLIPCQTYHIRLVVGDVGDNFYDSAVFLEAGSFNIGSAVKMSARSANAGTAVEGCSDGYFLFQRDEAFPSDLPLTVQFKVLPSGTASEGLDFLPLPAQVTIPAGELSAAIPVHLLNDTLQEGTEDLVLALDIPCACYTDTARLLITDPPPFQVTLPEAWVCENSTRALGPTVEGGIGEYRYAWSTGATTPVIEVTASEGALFALTVTDACDHIAADSVRIRTVEKPAATLSGEARVCAGDTARLEIHFTGVAPWSLTYTIDGVAQDPLTGLSENPFSLPAWKEGLYEVEAFSDAACAGEASGYGRIEHVQIMVAPSVEGARCADTADGRIEVEVSGGTPPYHLQWTGLPDAGLLVEDLEGGPYSLEVSDAGGCRVLTTIMVPAPSPLAEMTVDCQALANGRVNLQTGGGTPPYRFAVDDGDWFPSAGFDQLQRGQRYALVIEDANGCRREQDFFMPAPYNGHMAAMPPQIYGTLGTNIPLRPQLFVPPAQLAAIRWLPDQGLSCSDCLEPELTILQAQHYTLRLIDIFGCRDEISASVVVEEHFDVFIPNAFSPNADHFNDYFSVMANPLQVRRVRLMRVYNRWGSLIYEGRDLPVNEPGTGWDGRINGHPAPMGVYVYQIELEMYDGSRKMHSGDVMLMR